MSVKQQIRLQNRQTRYWHLFYDYHESVSAFIGYELVCEYCYFTKWECEDKTSPHHKQLYRLRKKKRKRKRTRTRNKVTN